MKSFLVACRPQGTQKSRLMSRRFPCPARVFGMISFLAVVGTAGVLVLGHSSALAQARPAAQGNAENGMKIFASANCQACHGNQGQGGNGPTAGPRIASPSMALPVFIDRVRNPRNTMPAVSASQVSDAALTDVYAFLKSIAAPAQPTLSATANAENGKRLYTSAGCYQCHNYEGQGGGRTGPRLAPNPIGFAAFVHQLREPSNQMPPYTGMVLSDGQVSDIYSYLQSIPKPPEVASIPLLK